MKHILMILFFAVILFLSGLPSAYADARVTKRVLVLYSLEKGNVGQDFFDARLRESLGCIVLDVKMRGMSGLDLQEHLYKDDRHLPIIFITGHGDIPIGVQAIKKGAIDFLTKPFDDIQLLSLVEGALQKCRQEKAVLDQVYDFRRRLKTLTPREYDVFLQVLSGGMNKQIAGNLNIKEHTVKVHRGRVMQKLSIASLADLVRLAEKAKVSR